MCESWLGSLLTSGLSRENFRTISEHSDAGAKMRGKTVLDAVAAPFGAHAGHLFQRSVAPRSGCVTEGRYPCFIAPCLPRMPAVAFAL